MMRGGSRRLLRILPFINPPVALQAVSLGAAGHELPHAASSRTGERQRMESRFRLREIDQVLRNAFFLENSLNHLLIATATRQRMLEGGTSAAGEVADVSSYRIGQH